MIDLSFLEQFTKGNTGKMQRYISIYLQEAPETLSNMHAALSASNWSEVGIHAHSLKPQADFMGIPDLKATLMDIEQAVRAQAYDNLEDLLEQAQSLHDAAAGELEDHLAG